MLYYRCIRTVSRNLVYLTEDEILCLAILPAHIKCAIIRLVTRFYGGFQDENILILLINKELKEIDLTISTVTEKTLEKLKICRILKELRLPALDFPDCTKETLCDLIPFLPQLQTVHLKDSPVVDDYVVSLLAKHCKRLDLLDLERCSRITDESMHHLKDMHLTKLNLAYTKISDRGIALLENSELESHLEDLNLKFCKISVVGLNRLNWDKIKYIGFEVVDLESKNDVLESKKGTGLCWFHRDIILA